MSALPLVRDVEGRLEIEWPTPPAREYPVSVELIAQWVFQENRRRDLEAALSAIKRVADETLGLNGIGNLHVALATIQEIGRVVLRPAAKSEAQ